MDINRKWYTDECIKRTKDSLEKNNYSVYVVETPEDAVKTIEGIIENGSRVSFGGSMTIIESGLLKLLRNGNYDLLDRYKEDNTPEDIANIFRESFFADYYITSTNALTEGGELVNMDGNGNRAAAMIFGPKKIIVMAGVNKITRNIEEAEARVRNIASPVNAKRLNRNTPCCKNGLCMDCNSKERICNHLVVTYRQNVPGRGIVILIKEDIGY